MKLFIYKSLIVIFLVFVLFHTTIGYVLRDYEAKIYNTFDKEKNKLYTGKDKRRNKGRY